MEWMDVVRRIRAGEDRHTEFKRGLGDLSAIGKAACAFANTEGGLIVLGVEDSKQITGIKEDAERVQERLTSFLQSGCSAPLHARTGRSEDPAGRVHWIEVPRQRGFEPLRYQGRVWVRRERSTVEPSATELQELYNAFGYILTEERAILDAPPTHIDLDAFRSYLERLGFDTTDDPQPDAVHDLRNRDVVVEVGGELRATLYGVLAFGRDPQRYARTRDFRIECVAYAGVDRAAEVLQVASAAGRVDEQVDRATGWFLGLGRFESYENLVREDRHLLPRPAIREALANAVTHRDYAITGSKVLLEVFDRRVDIYPTILVAPKRSTRKPGRPASRRKAGRTLHELHYVVKADPALGHAPAFVVQPEEEDVEYELLQPWIHSSEVLEGCIQWTRRHVVVLFDDDGRLRDLRRFPRLERRLHRFMPELTKRWIVRNGAPWYRTIDRIRASDWSRPKLLVPELAKVPRIALDHSGAVPSHGTYAIFALDDRVEDLYEVLRDGGLAQALDPIAPRLKGNYTRCYKRFLAQIRIPIN